MRGATVTQFGPPEVLTVTDVPRPRALARSVVIAVEAIDVLWVDTMIRRGQARDHFDATPPYTPGGAVVGIVDELGADVDLGWLGRRVVAGLEGGGYAERVAAPIRGLVTVPDGVDVHSAAALMLLSSAWHSGGQGGHNRSRSGGSIVGPQGSEDGVGEPPTEQA